MKTLFDIQSGRAITDENTLLIEAGSDYCCTGYWQKGGNRLDAVKVFSFDETEAEGRLAEIIDGVKKEPQAVMVCSAFAQALLVPNKFLGDDYSVLDSIYGGPAQAYFNDAVPEWGLTTVYSMPAAFNDVVQRSFSSVQFFHAYTPAIKMYNGYVADNQIAVHFTTSRFRVLFKKDSAIQLAQTYAYKTPLDVAYYLLKICYEFGLGQSDVHLILSGLIEKESALFAELQQFFSNVHFAHPPEMTLPNDSVPHHFFTSLYNLAQCAS